MTDLAQDALRCLEALIREWLRGCPTGQHLVITLGGEEAAVAALRELVEQGDVQVVVDDLEAEPMSVGLRLTPRGRAELTGGG